MPAYRASDFVSTPILRGLTTNADLSLPEAVQRCLRRPMAMRVAPSFGVTDMMTLTHLIPETDGYAVVSIDRHSRHNWERGATRLSPATEYPEARTRKVTRRRLALRETLDRFFYPDTTVFASIESHPDGSFSAMLSWLWWAEQVRSGISPEAAWVLMGLRMPGAALRHLRFDDETGLLSAGDPSMTLYAA